ncbi:MAG TPA: response regulator [Polyangiaceae bacterium]|nr:response regulator [Polyangiaceae bacterium]
MSDDAPVLIIDDDPRVRGVFRRVLENMGTTVLEADGGTTGLILCRQRKPAVVLLDLRMPEMDGLDVLSQLVAEHPETPVIVASGQGTMTDAVEALRRGAWDFVSKPLPDNEILRQAVRRGVERSALLRQNRAYSESLRSTNERLSDALHELRRDEQGARQLQFQLLPEDGLRIGRLRCERRLFPSQLLSGDFLDYFPLNERFAGFYLADVAGHGAASAFVTAILTTLVGKYREALHIRGDETILHPQQLLSGLDADLKALSIPKHVTFFYGVVNLESGQVVYGNAGAFPFPYLSNEHETIELEASGRPLNLPGGGSFGGGEARLNPGGRLLLVSDGVLELPPKRSHRERRDQLTQHLAQSNSMNQLVSALSLSELTPLRDDIALLLLHREESPCP